ncbi:potassium channel family protein, partial [Streptomyces luteogriseus]|uniref:potassium channel family protein n=1 Tax=Streptomyces luteogriseus TaxID=68233 RepID=UPI003FA371F7
MNVLIAGAGRLGTQVAQVLAASGNDVTLVDTDEARVDALRGRFGARLVVGDASEAGVQERAGAAHADLVVAATGRDEDNLVVSLLAKRRFAVPRVVARVNDDENSWLFDQRWGVDSAVPAAAPIVSLIEEATGAADTVALLRLSSAGVGIIETAITTGSKAAGRPLGAVDLPEGTLVATIVRDGDPTAPTPQTVLQPGDELLLVSHSAGEEEIHAAFQ